MSRTYESSSVFPVLVDPGKGHVIWVSIERWIDGDHLKPNFRWGTLSSLDVQIHRGVWTLGDVDRFVDATLIKGDSCGRDCVEGAGWDVGYYMRRAMSEGWGSEQHLKLLWVLRGKVHELVNDNTENP